MLKFNPLTGQLDDVGTPYDPTTDTIHVLKAGDTMTGNLLISNGTSSRVNLGNTSNYVGYNGDVILVSAGSVRASAGNAAIFFQNSVGAKFQVGGVIEGGTKLYMDNSGNLTQNGNILFGANNTYSVGSASVYAANIYASRHWINSTAYIDGASAGLAEVTGRFSVIANSIPASNAGLNVSAFPGSTGLTYGMRLRVIGTTTAGTYVGNTGEVFYGGAGTLNVGTGAQGTVTLQGSNGSVIALAESFRAVLNVTNTNASSSITNARGLSVISPSVTSLGTIANAYGVYIEDQTAATGVNYAIYTNAGDVRLMESANDKIGFHGATPIAQQTLATGAGRTVDDVITALQNLGIVKQS